MSEDNELLTQVVLMSLMYKEAGESIVDVGNILSDSKAMSLDEYNEIVLVLQKDGMIVDGELSFVGLALAQKAQETFKL
jgi:glycosyltransferase A (GT-A) superfamily protein (DUF2064 family)